MEMTDPRYAEVLPTPGEEEELLPGDRVLFIYNTIGENPYIVGLQVGRLEKKLEEDGRFALMGYIYDEQNHQLTFKCRVREPSEIPPQIFRAGGFGWGRLVLLAVGILAGLLLGGYVALRIYRMTPEAVYQYIQKVKANPDLTDAEKQRLIAEALARMEAPLLPPYMQPLSNVAKLILFGGLAVLAVVWLGAVKR